MLTEAGRHDLALREIERGLRLLQRLSSAGYGSTPEVEVRSQLLDLQGWTYLELGNYAAAELPLREVLHFREHLIETAPGNHQHLKHLSEVLNSLAVLRMQTARLDEGEALLRRALSIRHSLPEDERGDGVWLSDSAGLLGNLGTIDRDRGNYAAAEKSFREAIELQRQAIARCPKYQAYRHDLYITRWSLADTLLRAGRHGAAAEEVASVSGEFSERLQAHVEGVWTLMQCIAVSGLGERATAERYRAQAREIYQKTSTATFAPPAMQLELAWLLATCPYRELRDGQRAIEIVRQLLATDFQSDRLQHTLSAACLETGDYDEAYRAIQRSLRSSRGGSAYQFILLALAQAGRGQWIDARRAYTQAATAHEKLDPRTRFNVEHFSLEALFADAKTKLDTYQQAAASSTGEDK